MSMKTALPIKAIGKHRALYQVGGRVQAFVKVFGRVLGQLENPRTGKKEKMDPATGALIVSRGGCGYAFIAGDNETCAEALARYIETVANQ